MFFSKLLLLLTFSYSDSVSVSPGFVSIENTVFSLVEELEEDEVIDNDSVILSFNLRQRVSERLSYSSFDGSFVFSTALESSLAQRRRLGQNIYLIQSDLSARFSEDPSSEEELGSLDYRFQVEHGSENTTYRYSGYIEHFDEQSTSLGLEFNVIRSRDFDLCTLDDEATLKVDLIQEEFELRGIYDSKVYCMFSEHVEQEFDVYFVVSSVDENLFEEVKVSSETVISLSEAITLRHRLSYDDTVEDPFGSGGFPPGGFGGGGGQMPGGDFEAPQFFFGSGPQIGSFRLERFNEQPGFNNEVNLEYEVTGDGGCKNRSSLMLAAFRPLDQNREFKLWEVSLSRRCQTGEDDERVTQTFELSFGNAYYIEERGQGGFGGFNTQSTIPSEDESLSEPVNSVQLSYSFDSSDVDYDFTLNLAELNEEWIYDLTINRSLEYDSGDRSDLKFRLVSTEESSFLYTGVGYYYYDYGTQVESGLTSDFDANLYLSLGLSSQDSFNNVDYSWNFGFPLSDNEVTNQGSGLQTSERFFQLNIGSSECEPIKDLCWRGSIQREGDVSSLSFGGFLEF